MEILALQVLKRQTHIAKGLRFTFALLLFMLLAIGGAADVASLGDGNDANLPAQKQLAMRSSSAELHVHRSKEMWSSASQAEEISSSRWLPSKNAWLLPLMRTLCAG